MRWLRHRVNELAMSLLSTGACPGGNKRGISRVFATHITRAESAQKEGFVRRRLFSNTVVLALQVLTR
jgi:hypothetical protein